MAWCQRINKALSDMSVVTNMVGDVPTAVILAFTGVLIFTGASSALASGSESSNVSPSLQVRVVGNKSSDSAVLATQLKDLNCLTCHSVDKPMVGPSFRQMAEKYQDNPDAEALLISKTMTMPGQNKMKPPTPQVETAVRSILKLRS